MLVTCQFFNFFSSWCEFLNIISYYLCYKTGGRQKLQNATFYDSLWLSVIFFLKPHFRKKSLALSSAFYNNFIKNKDSIQRVNIMIIIGDASYKPIV